MDAHLPLYAQLKEAIIAAIAEDRLAPGDQLPSHHALCREYDTSYMTVRRAITELTNEGIIYTIHGKGSYVAEPKEKAEAGPLVSFTEDMATRGLQAANYILTAEIIDASTIMARTLQVEMGAPLVHLVRLRLANTMPIAIQKAFLPHQRCLGLLDHDLEKGSLYATLRNEYGLHLEASSGAVGATLATAEEAELLQLELPAALLTAEQITYLDTGDPIEFVRTVYRGDRYQMPLK